MADNRDQYDADRTMHSLLLTLAVVFIICGGNGAGLLLGVVLFRFTGQVLLSVLSAVVFTLLFFVLGILVFIHGTGFLRDSSPKSDPKP